FDDELDRVEARLGVEVGRRELDRRLPVAEVPGEALAVLREVFERDLDGAAALEGRSAEIGRRAVGRKDLDRDGLLGRSARSDQREPREVAARVFVDMGDLFARAGAAVAEVPPEL